MTFDLHTRDIKDEFIYRLMALKSHTMLPIDEMLPEALPVKLYYSKVEKMVDQNKLEYGTSMRSCWPCDYALDDELKKQIANDLKDQLIKDNIKLPPAADTYEQFKELQKVITKSVQTLIDRYWNA